MTQEDTTPKALSDGLLEQVESALAASGTSASKFGYRVAGDPSLVFKMRRGRRVMKPDLRRRVAAEVAELQREAILSAFD